MKIAIKITWSWNDITCFFLSSKSSTISNAACLHQCHHILTRQLWGQFFLLHHQQNLFQFLQLILQALLTIHHPPIRYCSNVFRNCFYFWIFLMASFPLLNNILSAGFKKIIWEDEKVIHEPGLLKLKIISIQNRICHKQTIYVDGLTQSIFCVALEY